MIFPDPRQQGRFRVAANGHGVAPIGGVVEQPEDLIARPLAQYARGLLGMGDQ